MLFLAILIGCVVGAFIGINLPTIPYTYSSYLAISIIAALDSVFGGIVANLNGKFDFNLLEINIFDPFKSEILEVLKILVIVLIVIIIHSIFKIIVQNLNNSSNVKIISFIQYLIIVSITLELFGVIIILFRK